MKYLWIGVEGHNKHFGNVHKGKLLEIKDKELASIFLSKNLIEKPSTKKEDKE